MSLVALIDDTSKAIANDPANGQVEFTALGTLVGVTEVDITTGAHTFKVDEPPALAGRGGDARHRIDGSERPRRLDTARGLGHPRPERRFR